MMEAREAAELLRAEARLMRCDADGEMENEFTRSLLNLAEAMEAGANALDKAAG